jgi:glutaminyl-tRNA synthetase
MLVVVGSGSEASQRKVAGTLHWVSINMPILSSFDAFVCLLMTPDSHKEKKTFEFKIQILWKL